MLWVSQLSLFWQDWIELKLTLDILDNNIHYTIGHDIYIGWSAAIAAFVVAGALLFGACNTNEEDDYEVYEPGQTYDGVS